MIILKDYSRKDQSSHPKEIEINSYSDFEKFLYEYNNRIPKYPFWKVISGNANPYCFSLETDRNNLIKFETSLSSLINPNKNMLFVLTCHRIDEENIYGRMKIAPKDILKVVDIFMDRKYEEYHDLGWKEYSNLESKSLDALNKIDKTIKYSNFGKKRTNDELKLLLLNAVICIFLIRFLFSDSFPEFFANLIKTLDTII